MGGKSKAPAPPDYQALAEEQARSSREVTEQQTWANRPTQITPWGRQDWYSKPVWDPSTGQYLNRWVQSTELNPLSQRALDAQLEQTARKSELGTSMLGRLENEFGSEMDWGQLDPMQRAALVPEYQMQDIQRRLDYSGLNPLGTSEETRNRAEDAIYNRGASRLDRRTSEGRSALETKLYNQGLRPGDEAYDRAMQTFEEGATDAYGQLTMDSIIGGGQEASRDYGMDLSTRQQYGGELERSGGFYNSAADQFYRQMMGIGGQEFNQNMTAAGFGNTVRQQQIAESMQRRGFTLNEINAIMSGQQVGMPQMPGFNTASKSEAVQSLAAGNMQFQAGLDAASLDNAANQALLEGVTGLGSAAIMS